MGDRMFEADLERAFAESPAFADAERFSQTVTDALGRGWAFRRLLIGALGVAGGLIGGAQFLRAGLFDHLGSVALTWRMLAGDVSQAPIARDLSTLLTSGASMDREVLWMSGALAVLAVGLMVTRSIRQI